MKKMDTLIHTPYTTFDNISNFLYTYFNTEGAERTARRIRRKPQAEIKTLCVLRIPLSPLR